MYPHLRRAQSEVYSGLVRYVISAFICPPVGGVQLSRPSRYHVPDYPGQVTSGYHGEHLIHQPDTMDQCHRTTLSPNPRPNTKSLYFGRLQDISFRMLLMISCFEFVCLLLFIAQLIASLHFLISAILGEYPTQ